MSRKIKVAVLGVGHLGQHHARIYHEHPNAELVAVVDPDETRGREIAKKCKTDWIGDYKELVGKVEAASIAVPTVYHYPIAKELLKNGIHCMVEKPITDSVETASGLVALAQAQRLVLQVGHIERFNAAVERLQQVLDRPAYIEAQRLGPFDPRVKDIGVVLDLMIHDLDIILQCAGSEVVDIQALGVNIFTNKEDIASVRLRFASGCIANITASRVTPKKTRKIRIFQRNAYMSIDYAKQRMQIYRKRAIANPAPGEPRWKIKHDTEKFEYVEPLKKELEHFLYCVEEGVEPAVTGEHGTTALDLAIEITRKIREEMSNNPSLAGYVKQMEMESQDSSMEGTNSGDFLPQPSVFADLDLDDEEED